MLQRKRSKQILQLQQVDCELQSKESLLISLKSKHNALTVKQQQLDKKFNDQDQMICQTFQANQLLQSQIRTTNQQIQLQKQSNQKLKAEQDKIEIEKNKRLSKLRQVRQQQLKFQKEIQLLQRRANDLEQSIADATLFQQVDLKKYNQKIADLMQVTLKNSQITIEPIKPKNFGVKSASTCDNSVIAD